MCISIHPKTLARILQEISNLLIEASVLHPETTEDEYVDKILSRLNTLITIAHDQLSNILDRDAAYHSIFPRFFEPNLDYIDENTIRKYILKIIE